MNGNGRCKKKVKIGKVLVYFRKVIVKSYLANSNACVSVVSRKKQRVFREAERCKNAKSDKKT